MKICGFTFVRNAVKYDYPVIESITSILPIVDLFIVSVGNSDDNTVDLIRSIDSPKIRIVHSTWDDSLKKGGKVLAVETNKALEQIPPGYDWAFYLQADEVVHEKDLAVIVAAANQYSHDQKIEGLLFRFIHFYGSYNYTGDSRRWYKHETRLIKYNGNMISIKDAQGFRTRKYKKLNVKKIDADIYHYGWVRHPEKQFKKIVDFSVFWNGEGYIPPGRDEKNQFDFLKDVDSVELFKGTHPLVMKHRIAAKTWNANFDTSKKKFSFKDILLYRFEKLTGRRIFSNRNYKIK